MKKENRDTPLAPTPDLKTVLDEINTRIAERNDARKESMSRVNAARAERSKQKKSVAGGDRLYGLASFAGTTGRK